MMEFTIALRDYRIIKDAKLKFEPGLTLISASNSNGKSTVIRALLTCLKGTFSEEGNNRHGCDGYVIALKSDDERVIIQRKNSSTSIKHNSEPPVAKLGRGGLDKLCPSFPLKKIDFENTSFYPNFVFQGAVPLYEDISVFDLFSAMFSSVGKVNIRLDTLKKEGTRLSKSLSDATANVNYLQSELLKTESGLHALEHDHPNFEEDWVNSQKVYAFQTEVAALSSQLSGLESSPDFAQNLKYLSLVSDAQPLFPVLDFVDDVQSYVAHIESFKTALATLESPCDVDYDLLVLGLSLSEFRDSYASVPVIDFLILELGTNLGILKAELDSINSDLGSLPEVDLIKLGSELAAYKVDHAFVSSTFEEVDRELRTLTEEFLSSPCQYTITGKCPYLEVKHG